MRTRMHLLAVLGLAIATAACGSSDDAATTVQPATTAAPATTAGPPTTAAPTTAASTAATAAPTTAASTDALDALLLRASDLGGEWQVGEDVNEADLAAFAQLPCEDQALNPTILARLTAVTGIQFDPVDRSYRHIMELLVTGDPARLDADLEILREATRACASTGATVPRDDQLTVHELSIPQLGDQRMAFLLTGAEAAGSPVTWYVRGAVVRVGAVAIGFGLTEILDTPRSTPTYSDEQFAQYVAMAVDRLGG